MTQAKKIDPWFLNECQRMESEIGRGWKRQLAEKVGVGESNVQVWLRSGRVPAAVRRAIELGYKVEELRQELIAEKRLTGSRWITEEHSHGTTRYSVQEMNKETGRARIIATGISKLEDAHDIVGIPQIKELILQAFDQFGLEEQFRDYEDIELLKSLENWPGKTAQEEEEETEKMMLDKFDDLQAKK